MMFGLRLPSVPLSGISAEKLVDEINKRSDIYSIPDGRPLQVGRVYACWSPLHSLGDVLVRCLSNGKSELSHYIKGRFELHRPLEEKEREIVAQGRFSSRDSIVQGRQETEENLVLNVLSPIFAQEGLIMPGRIAIRTESDETGPAEVVEYTYSTKTGGNLIDGKPIEKVIPVSYFII